LFCFSQFLGNGNCGNNLDESVKRVPFAAAIKAAAIHSGLLRTMTVKDLAEMLPRYFPRVA